MTTRKGPGTGIDPRLIIFSVLAVVWVLVNCIGWAAIKIAGFFGGPSAELNPLMTIPQITVSEEPVWSVGATVVAAVMAAGVMAAFWVWVFRYSEKKAASHEIDKASKSMAPASQLRDASKQAVQASSRRLGGEKGKSTQGFLLTRHLAGKKQEIYMSDEETLLMIAGPRSGKSESMVIPAIASAPGSVVATSSKSDIVDSTLLTRAKKGRVHIFDPQHIFDAEGARWWWNPLKYVSEPAHARRLASYFADGCREEDAKKDAYFDDEAEQAFAAYILAAAVAGGDLTNVFDWLMNPANKLPVKILETAGFDRTAKAAEQRAALTERQRDGIMGMARRYIASSLEDPDTAIYILPPAAVSLGVKDGKIVAEKRGDRRHCLPEFDIEDFVKRDEDTLYLLTRSGADSATGITTALVGEIFQMAIRRAQRSPRRRLETPMRAVLDEVANCVPLRDLPKWFSDFGSQGILPMAFLQSWHQGRNVWGESGMKALVGASNVHIYGGKCSDKDYLSDLSTLVGETYVRQRSFSTSSSGQSHTNSYTKESILTVADLVAMPVSRQLVMKGGIKPILGEKIHWKQTIQAHEIQESQKLAETRSELMTKVGKLQQKVMERRREQQPA